MFNCVKEKIGRVWIISDIHFGVHNNSKEWLDLYGDYFDDFFIPLLQKNKEENDVLFVLGDTIDNRQNINSLILNKMLEIFDSISKLMKIYVLIGNHDIAYKSHNEVNSLKYFHYHPNIKLIEDPLLIDTQDKKLYLVPWRKDNEQMEETLQSLEKENIEYLFTHHDYNGLKLNRATTINSGIDLDEKFKKIKKIFNGHIHLRQEQKNLTVVGCPMHQTRNDIGNQKGIYLLDLKTDKIKFYENNVTPKYVKIKLTDYLDKKTSDFINDIRGNFLDLLVKDDLNSYLKWSDISIYLKEPKKVQFEIYKDEIEEEDIYLFNYDNFRIEKELDNYISSMKMKDPIKQLVKEKIKSIHDKVTKMSHEEL